MFLVPHSSTFVVVSPAHLVQQGADLLPLMSLAVVDDVVTPTTAANHLPQTRVLPLQVYLHGHKPISVSFLC